MTKAVKRLIGIGVGILSIVTCFVFLKRPTQEDTPFVSYEVDVSQQDLRLYWKDEKGVAFTSIENLKSWVGAHQQELVFAMNGGMFKPDFSPQGLFIQDGRIITPIDTSSGAGNFYLKPNGIFYITADKQPAVVATNSFVDTVNVQYATQSGPMLVLNGQIHPAFTKGSVNVQIRNGVGILPDKRVLFAMSKEKINFYDFASYFKSKGCQNALYLDGFVCRTYLPEKHWVQTDGAFGVIVGVTIPDK